MVRAHAPGPSPPPTRAGAAGGRAQPKRLNRRAVRIGQLCALVEAIGDDGLHTYLAALLREGLRRGYTTEQLTLGFPAEDYEGILPAVLRCWRGKS